MARKNPLAPRLVGDRIELGPHCNIILHRTLRLPDDGGVYPLPPSLGSFPIKRVSDYRDRVPASWREHGGLFFPMYQREAMWLGFEGHSWHPQALKIAVGKVNAVNGEEWDEDLGVEEQDYVVVPTQPWLDGINAGVGHIKQFVAMPLGMGYTVEGQVTGVEEFGGIQLKVHDAVAGRFPDEEVVHRMARRRGGLLSKSMPGFGMLQEDGASAYACASPMLADAAPGAEMGLAAGGRMEQKVYPDPYGVETWDAASTGRVYIHIVNSEMYRFITGEDAPASPISAATYTEHGYPWYSLYDERRGDVAPSETLEGVRSVGEMDSEHGFKMQDDTTVPIPHHQAVGLGWPKDPSAVEDGRW